MSGLMACRMLRLALVRITSSRVTRLSSPCSINTRMAASRMECPLVIWVSACSKRTLEKPRQADPPRTSGWSREQKQAQDAQH